MHYDRGNKHLEIGEIEDAKFYFRKAIEVQPNFHPAMVNLGVIAFEEEDFLSAREYLFNAITLNPSSQRYREIYIECSEKSPVIWNEPPPPPEIPKVEFIPHDNALSPISSIRPIYPIAAMVAGIEGTVIVQVFVDKNGDVTETSIMKGIPHSGLNGAAVKAIKSTKFKPATQNGEPIGVWITIPLVFKLEK